MNRYATYVALSLALASIPFTATANAEEPDAAFFCEEIRSYTTCWDEALVDRVRKAIAKSGADNAEAAAPLVAEELSKQYEAAMAEVDRLCEDDAEADPASRREKALHSACLADTTVIFCPIAEELTRSGADPEIALLVLPHIPEYLAACASPETHEAYEGVLAMRDREAWSEAERELAAGYAAGEIRRDAGKQEKHLEKALIAARKSRVPAQMGWFLTQRAGMHIEKGTYDRAATALDNAEPVVRMTGDRMAEANVAILRAWIAKGRGDVETTILRFAEALDLYAPAVPPDAFGTASLNALIGVELADVGLCGDAKPYLEAAESGFCSRLPAWHSVRTRIEEAIANCRAEEAKVEEAPTEESGESVEPEASSEANEPGETEEVPVN